MESLHCDGCGKRQGAARLSITLIGSLEIQAGGLWVRTGQGTCEKTELFTIFLSHVLEFLTDASDGMLSMVTLANK